MNLKKKLDEAKIRQAAYFQGKQDAESELLPKIERLSSEGAVMREALKEIAKGEGRYDMDQLKHASNTIEDMVHLANNALATLTQMAPVSEGTTHGN